MKKTVKRFLIATLSLLFTGLVFTACSDELNSSSPSLENSPFLETYQAEYGEVYYFETSVLNGKPLEYSVSQGGNNIAVNNYGFMVSSLEAYTVNVKYLGTNGILDTFEIQAQDNGAPHIAFSYQEKFVLEGETVVLPTVSVSDNKDKDVQYTAKLMQEDEEIPISGNEFQAVSGEYRYTVTAKDASGNTTEKTCSITAGGKLDVAKAVNWTSASTDVEYCREISGGTMDVSDEIVYGGFKSSFKVTINDPTATTCVTVKNALIEDISEYDYFLVYIYNNMTSSRRYSVNWSSNHVGTLTQNAWVPVIYPINENLVSDSNNDILQVTQDWKNCNGLRFYIQDGSAASGSIYFTDIFLLNVPNESEFLDDITALEALTASEDWQSQYNLVDVESNVLKAAGAEIDFNSTTGRINAKYSQLLLGGDYDDNTLAYADKKMTISQLVGSGDMWSLPASVEKNMQVKYGNENGSFEITFRLDRNRANTAVINPSVYKKAPAGEVVFMVKNATNSRLKIYTNETAQTGLWPIEVSDEWQEVRLAVKPSSPLKSLEIILYTMDETLIQPLEDGTAKVYYSNIRFVPYEESGNYLPMNENYVNTFTEKWAGQEEISFINENDKQYNGNGVMSVSHESPLMGGRYGFYLNTNKLAALLENGSVKLTVTYNVTNVSHTGKYIGFYGMPTMIADRGEGWHQISTIFTAMPQHFIFCIGSNGSFAWDGYEISGEMLIANISYEYAEPPEFSVAASTTLWQNPESVIPTNEYLYGEETESYKAGFKAGYRYANIVIKPYIEVESGYIEFYFKNMTGKALEIYTTESLAENGGVTSISADSDWQLIRLAVDSAADTYEIQVRGAGESIVNESEVAYYYISTIRVGQ